MDLASKIDNAIKFVKDAHDDLKSGNLTLLKEFEDLVREIQKDVISQTFDKPELYAAKLEVLATALREFEVDLRALQIDIKYELMSLNQKQQAVKAYQMVNHSASPKPEDENNE